MVFTTDSTFAESVPAPAAPPKTIKLPPREWIKQNLFSTPFNSVLTVLFGALIFAAWRGLLSFTFSHERSWDAVATNLRLMFTAAYPQEQFIRIWVCIGFILGLAAITVGAYAVASRVRVHFLAERTMVFGGVIGVSGLLAPFSTSATVWYIVIGFGLLLPGIAARTQIDEEATLPLMGLLGIAFALPVLSLWVIPYGHHALLDGELIAEPGTVARSSSGPWTVVLIISYALYLLVAKVMNPSAQARLKRAVVGIWLVSPLFLVFIILRDPAFDYDHIASVQVPLFLAYAILGGALLYWLTKPGVGEIGRIVAATVLLAAIGTFLFSAFGFGGMRQIVRILALALAAFALLAPTFSGEQAARRRYVRVWVITVLGLVWFVTAANSPSTVATLSDWFPGGFSVTLMVATFTLILSFPLGVVLALARTSKMPIFRVMSTFYIEIVRGVPFITVLVFFAIMVPLFLPSNMEISQIAAVVVAYSLFSAAYMAENVRGGLQSIQAGQHEAAEALGMTGTQKTVFIVLPQALRASIPPLVGQTIGTFKETSLLAIIGVFDFLFVARTLIPAQTFFLGSLKEGLLVVCLTYWFFTYNMSKASQRLEQRLGVGER